MSSGILGRDIGPQTSASGLRWPTELLSSQMTLQHSRDGIREAHAASEQPAAGRRYLFMRPLAVPLIVVTRSNDIMLLPLSPRLPERHLPLLEFGSKVLPSMPRSHNATRRWGV